MTQRAALELTIASDPALSEPVHAATINLARSLADEIDDQIKATGTAQTRTTATYSGQLAAIRRIVRDARADRTRTNTPVKTASRLALIKAQAQAATGKAPE
jgi:hypothetical protein